MPHDHGHAHISPASRDRRVTIAYLGQRLDAFLIGTEMPGLTTIRSGASTYPAVQAYRDLLADVRSIRWATFAPAGTSSERARARR